MTVMATEGAAAAGLTREQLLAAPRSGARPLPGSPGADPAAARHPAARRSSAARNVRARSAPPGRPATGGPGGTRTPPGPSSPAGTPAPVAPAAAGSPGSTAAGSSPGFSRTGQGSGFSLPGSGSGSGKAYHRIVMAEFVLTIILIGLSPVLTPRRGDSGAPQDVAAAVSFAAPLVRLTAACIVFFALALASTGEKSGKLAAAFGGLIALGTLLNATDMLTAIGQAFAPRKPKASGAGPAGPDVTAA